MAYPLFWNLLCRVAAWFQERSLLSRRLGSSLDGCLSGELIVRMRMSQCLPGSAVRVGQPQHGGFERGGGQFR